MSEASEESPWLEASAEIGYSRQFKSDLDDDGNMAINETYGIGHFAIRLTDRVRMRTVATYHGAAFEFDDAPVIDGSSFAPWSTIHVVRLNPLVDVELNRSLRVFAGPIFEAALENGADLGDSVKFGGLVGAEYIVIPEKLKVGLGLLGVSEIEEGQYFQPLLLLEWQPRDRLTIRAESWTTRGGSLELRYQATDRVEVAASVTYRRERFRLKLRTLSTDPDPDPDFRAGSEGIAEDRAVIPALRISYLPRSEFVEDVFGSLRIDLEVGLALAGELTIEARNGQKFQKLSYDPAPSLGLRFVIPL